ncbi:hypothetical protein TARUN_4921 [Trichoderma arundinaceum]|uniref:Uncharacterized protein n=1 Tax=Trichoderma arundinaceum TaxID=490622 RepID=A0A395NN39_TRIAR|nr:hypothetical protein TARUN_4921 [Trichoderma arundinaceum]
MFEAAISALNDISEKHPWVGELAGILPLTAFIDFIDFTKIHIFELTGGALPLWSWPVTPAGGRLLLSDEYMQKSCCLDREGRTQALMVSDGRYGDQYALNNPETLKMCISSQGVHIIDNNHSNMLSEFVRAQDLEIILVSRTHPEHKFKPPIGWPGRLLGPWLTFPHRHLFISIMGWLMLFGMIIMSGILRCFLSLAFLIVIPITGVTIYCLYGRRPRVLPFTPSSGYNRLTLNPDTFSWDWHTGQDDRTKLSERAMKWLDRILAPDSSRAMWEEATRAAMDKAYQEYMDPTEILQSSAWKEGKGEALGQDWQIGYGDKYWGRFVVEGIYMAAKIREEARLSGRKLSESI